MSQRTDTARAAELSADPRVRDQGAVAVVLGPVSAVLAAFYVLLGIAHVFVLPAPSGAVMSTVALVSALLLGALAWRLREAAPPLRWAHPLMAGVLWIVVLNSVAHLVLVEDPAQTTNVLMAIIGAGVAVMSLRWSVIVISGAWLAWIVGFALLPSPPWVHWTFAMAIATFIAQVVRVGRRSSLQRAADAVRQVEEIAVQDSLTGLANRRGLQLLGGEVLSVSARVGRSVGCAFIDVDGLKAVNDRYGHDRGDDLLRAVGAALRDVCRTTDVLARWGGDEFVVVSVGPPPRDDELEARLRDQLTIHPGLPAELWRPRVSVGTAVADPGSGVSLADLLDRADAAMYARRAERRAAEADQEADQEARPAGSPQRPLGS